MNRILLALLCAFGLTAPVAFAHGGSFRGPNGGIPPGLREPSDPEPPPPPPTDPVPPGGPITPTDPNGPVTPDDDANPTPGGSTPPAPEGPSAGPRPKSPATKTGLTMDSWRFWWSYNNDRILNLKSHIYSTQVSSSSAFHFLTRQDEANRRNPQRPTMNAVVNKIVPALMRSLERPRDHEDIHGGALVALGKIGAPDAIKLFEAAANNRYKTSGKGIAIKFGYQAVESAVLGLGLLPDLDERTKAEAREVLLAILDNDKMRSRERAWAAVSLGMQRDSAAVRPLWERLTYKYTGKDKVNVPAGILCGLGLIGDESIRLDLEAALISGKIEKTELSNTTRSYVAYAIGKIGSSESVGALAKVLKSRRFSRLVKRSVAIALGTCGANAEGPDKAIAVSALKRYLSKSGGDMSGENFAIIALSQIGTTDALNHLLHLADAGKYGQRPYAALGLATHVWYVDRAHDAKQGEPMDTALRARIKARLTKLSNKYKDTGTKAAFLLSRGLLRDKTVVEQCVKLVSRRGDPTLRGFCCVALGLVGVASEDVKDALRGALRERKSADLRRDAATGLGLLRDADAVKLLIDELNKSKSFAVQGQLITAIGTIGDHTAIDPLIEILDNTNRPAATRAMAAVGLGMIGDLLPVSRLSRLSENYNYRATVEDLDELLYIL